ncbi:hypothetical protein HDU76_007257, partial [Blyttiomyces sp. JEL0837]
MPLKNYIRSKLKDWINLVASSFAKPSSPNHLAIVKILLEINATLTDPSGTPTPAVTIDELRIVCNDAITKDQDKLCKLVWPFAYPDYDFNNGTIPLTVFNCIMDAKWSSSRIDFFLGEMGVTSVYNFAGTSGEFLDVALEYFTRVGSGGNLKVAERLIAVGADINFCKYQFDVHGEPNHIRYMWDILAKAGVYISDDVVDTDFVRLLIAQCTRNETELVDYMIELGALNPLTLVQTDLKDDLPVDRSTWTLPLLIETI